MESEEFIYTIDNNRCGSLILDSPEVDLETISNSLQAIIESNQDIFEDTIHKSENQYYQVSESLALKPLESVTIHLDNVKEPEVILKLLPSNLLESIKSIMVNLDSTTEQETETDVVLESSFSEVITENINKENFDNNSGSELSLISSNMEIETSLLDEKNHTIAEQIKDIHDNKSQCSSIITALCDSVHESITNSIKNDCMNKFIDNLIDNNLINLKPNTNSKNNIDNIIENTVKTTMETITLTDQNQNDIINKSDKINIKELIINNIDELVPAPHHSVSFSTSDLNDITGIVNNGQNNSLGNTSSLNTSSEFSYTKKIKNKNQPNIIPQQLYHNIRMNIPNKKKIKRNNELDEVDYLYNKLQDYIRYVKLNVSNYMILITKAMEIIENYNNFTSNANNSKKDVVIKALNRLIMVDLELSDFDKKVFLSTISNFIELIVMCSKKYSKINSTSIKDNFNNKNDGIDDIVLASCGQVIHSLIDKLTTIVLKNQYNAEKIATNIPTLTEILMLIADKYVFLTGIEKKNIVIQAIEIFVSNKLEYIIELDNEKKTEIIQILACVPNTIDLFIALQKQKYKINKKRMIKIKKQSGCLKSIFTNKKRYEED
jgi:hypothetical protein